MKKVLVTGGAGFIGSHLVDALLADDYAVLVVDNLNDYYNPKIKKQNTERHQNNQHYKFELLDILEYDRFKALAKDFKPDYIIHLAARVGVRPSLDQARLYEEVNIRGSLNVLEIAADCHCRNTILASSSSVYGNTNKIPFSETDDVDHPVSPYAATKRAMEILAYTAHKLWGINCTCLRFFNVYGERGRPDNIPAMFTKLAMDNQPIPKFGDGSTKRDYTYVADIVKGIISCLTREFGYEIINLGNNHPVSLNDFITTLEKTINRRIAIDQKPEHPADVPVTYANISKADKLLAWQPQTSLSEGLKRYFEWYQVQEKASRA